MYTAIVKDKSLLPKWVKGEITIGGEVEITLSNDRYKAWHEKGIIQTGRHYYKMTKTVTCPGCKETHKHNYKKYVPYQTIKKPNPNDEDKNWG